MENRFIIPFGSLSCSLFPCYFLLLVMHNASVVRSKQKVKCFFFLLMKTAIDLHLFRIRYPDIYESKLILDCIGQANVLIISFFGMMVLIAKQKTNSKDILSLTRFYDAISTKKKSFYHHRSTEFELRWNTKKGLDNRKQIEHLPGERDKQKEVGGKRMTHFSQYTQTNTFNNNVWIFYWVFEKGWNKDELVFNQLFIVRNWCYRNHDFE